MEQISIFETLKPRVILKNDEIWINSRLTQGAEFELFMETEEHYIILIDDVYYGIFKCECEVVK